uniref:Apple domain-containing protein n=1 Tax=Panagrellus redivivus TaxID=6233 RepID=A0A7E4VF62_PANRE
MAGGVRSSRRRHLHRRRFSSCLRGAMGKKLRMPLKCAIGSDGWAHLHLTSKKASSRNRSSSSLASGDSDSVWSHGQAGRKEEREKHKTKGASLDCNARQAALRGKFVSFLLRACFLPSSPHRHAYGLRRFWSHRYSVAELRVEHRRDFRSAMPPDSVARSLRVLVLICLIQSTLSKTICSRRQHTLDNSNFYQRVQVSSNVACIERCIDNIDVCQAVIFVEQHSPTPVKRFCQLYSMNSESRNVKVRPEAQYEPRTTLYEIVENCPAGVAADEGPMLDKIDEKLREIVLNFGGSSRGASDDETRIAVFDDVHTPEFTPSRSRERVSGKSYASTPPQYPFSSGNNDRDRSEERFEVKEPSPFRPVHDPIPIQPVSILHNGQPFDQTGVAQFPCFSPNCRSSQLPLSYPTPCPASHRGDPCAPKPRISYNVETPTEPPRPFWSEWSSAGSCTVSCGHGSRHRRRFCSTGHNSDCEGEDSKAEPCELPACDVWSEWGPWSACPATCGGANQRRTRYCNNGIHCVGEAEEHRGCAEVECPHWGSWAGWRECSASCGFGVSKRVRECLPVGTIGCIGPGEDVQSCESRPCPEWSPWEPWTECTRSCGGGERQRRRECLHGPNDCVGPAEEHVPCNQQTCPTWSEWSFWTQCSATCGDDGTKIRTRQCQYEGFPSNLCPGTAQDQTVCNLDQCPYWGSWSSWSPCSASCGHGQQTRARRCEPYGSSCVGGDRELRFCQQAVCPYWDQWAEWGGCSVSCGRGFCERRRRCVIGDPLPGGDLPNLDDFDEGEISSDRKEALKDRIIERAQQINRSQTSKGKSIDQQTVGQGSLRGQVLEVAQSNRRLAPKSAARQTFNSTQRFNAEESLECSGPEVDRKECDAGPCCDWSQWASWSACNSQCGPGSKVRSRICQVDVPFNGGLAFPTDFRRGKRQAWPPQYPLAQPPRPSVAVTTFSNPVCNCDGPSVETAICVAAECRAEPQSDPCSWSEWSGWCDCSGNCQQGLRARTRYCRKGDEFNRRGFRGDQCDCPGDKVQTQDCIPINCRNGGTSLLSSSLGAVRERDAMLPRGSVNEIAVASVILKPKIVGRTDDFVIRERDEDDEDAETEDDVNSCSWSEWSDWTKCGTDFLKQRTRFCIGLKALINNCECHGATMEQTSCTPDVDAHNFKPPSKAVLAVSRDILHERLAHKERNNPEEFATVTLSQNPKTLIRPANANLKQLRGSDLVTAHSNEDADDSDDAECTWSPWKPWGKCNAACGETGERIRRRKCPCGDCVGIAVESEECTGKPCNFNPNNDRRNPFD